MMENEFIIGIDLGTTNSEVAVIKNDKIEIISENDQLLVPSYVSLSPDNQILVGHEARNSYLLHPERTIKSIKRKMGSSEKVKLGEREYLPQEISALILKELKQRAERYLETPVSKAVITVPAYFSDSQRQATRDAGSIAGLEVVRILNEPTAACLAFEHDEKDQSKIIMAFDLGGGTFDVSIVQMEGELVEVIGSHGDNQLGGDDFDELIYNHLIAKVYDNQKTPNLLTTLSENRIRRAAELAKMRLTDDYYCKIIEENLDTISGTKEHLKEEFSREQLEAMSDPLVSKTLASVHQALAAAGKKPKDIDEVILVGGSTRMPIVFELLKRELKKTPRHDIHPDLAVVSGAALMAGRLMGKKNQRILVDITPYTFGTTAFGYIGSDYVPYFFVPIIEAGTPLPVRRTKQFYTMVDGQAKCKCSIFQGENEDARKNIMVGEFTIDGLSSSAPEGSPIIVHMDLDLDGILMVTATEKCTGLTKNVIIEKSLEKMTEETIRKSKDHITDLFGDDGGEILEATRVLDVESKEKPSSSISKARIKDCSDLLKRVEQSKGSMDEVDKKDSTALAEDLRAAMDANDEEEVSRIFTELEDLLFYVETN